MPIEIDEFERWMQRLDEGQKGIHARLDLLNGKINLHATEIAVLKDRDERAFASAHLTGKKIGAAWAGGIGTALAGFAYTLYERFSQH